MELPVITKEEAFSYLAAKKTSGMQISIGVFLCIIAAATLILLNKLFEDKIIGAGLSEDAGSILSLIPLLLMVAVAVAIFIYSDTNIKRYKYIEDGVTLPIGLQNDIKQMYDRYNRTYTLSVIIGVCMLILSPIPLLVYSINDVNDSSIYGVVVLLVIAAFAVVDLIYFGVIREGYCRLLQLDEFTPIKNKKKKKEEKVIGLVASIVWPLATAIFLFNGFMYNLWDKAWIVFPITGVLFGMFCAAYSAITDNNK